MIATLLAEQKDNQMKDKYIPGQFGMALIKSWVIFAAAVIVASVVARIFGVK